MKKLLRTRDILLLGLAGALEIYQEVKDPFNTFADGYKFLYGYTPRKFRKENYRHLVWRSLKTGYIEKIVKGDRVYLRLTSKGRKKIKRDFPLFLLQKKKWDGKWRIVIFDIMEKNRSIRKRLREKLIELGFGMLQKSVWITPFDIIVDFREFIKTEGLSRNVYAMEVNHLLAGDKKELASQVWKLERINRKYQKLLDEINSLSTQISRLKSGADRHKKLNVKGENKVKEIKKKYFKIILSDPHLPKELLPSDWKGKLVAKKVRGLTDF